jgi:hypothetical protein
MKLFTVIIFMCSLQFGSETKQVSNLALLAPNENFKVGIINCVLDDSSDSSAVIMIRIQEKSRKNIRENESYEVRVTKLGMGDFSFFNFVNDKYFGYFEYKKHIVLVYGDNDNGFFFSKEKIRKRFNFLSIKKYDDKKHPPISIEPIVFIYNFSGGEFTPGDEGRFDFFQ